MRSTRFIIFLESIKPRRAGKVGGKALGLARMAKAGFSIPSGFCVTTRAYRQHISSPTLARLLDEKLPQLNQLQAADGTQALSDIRQAIIEAPLSARVAARVAKAFRALSAKQVAVRSSASAEDLREHSFAGQYDTYLDIASVEDCLQAIKKCWASVWTSRAYEYRTINKICHRAVDMAVIIQELVPADASGVVFTVDPVTERPNCMIIEACLGLGDALGSGRAVPDRFEIAKTSLEIISRTIESGRASSPAINDALVGRIAKLAKKIEAEFGCPQDIEWAVSDNQVYLLQSRPVTTLTQAKSSPDRYIWSNFATQEVMPDVLTPITRSVVNSWLQVVLGPLFDILCIDRAGVALHDYFAGRIYFNASLWTAVLRCIPGADRYDWAEFAGSNPALTRMLEIFEGMTEKDLPKIRAKRIRLALKIPLLIVGIISCTPKKGQIILEQAKRKNEQWQHLDASSMSISQIADCCTEIGVRLGDMLRDAPYLFGAMIAYPALNVVCARWLSDGTYAGRLLAGVGNIDDAQAAMDLWQLALKANELPELKKRILEKESWHNIAPEISRLPRADKFLKCWNDFMADHGHHCRAELELYNARWSECPDYILGLVRGYISCIDKANPLENYERIAQKRRSLEQQCRRRLKNPIKRLIFKLLVVRSQNGAVFRENIKSEVVKLLTTMRKLLIELGSRLHARNVLADPDDVFFLTLEEIEPVASGSAQFDIKNVVAARRAEYDRNNLLAPPDLIIGGFDADSHVPEQIETDFEVLKGLAVSPGVATGKAKVIVRTDSEAQIEAGEILVAPFTDPGWTPYFLPAAGVIMEQGGILSHGSIVARELGIPVVTNVGLATKIIKTGQTIRLNGNSGTVTMLQ